MTDTEEGLDHMTDIQGQEVETESLVNQKGTVTKKPYTIWWVILAGVKFGNFEEKRYTKVLAFLILADAK